MKEYKNIITTSLENTEIISMNRIEEKNSIDGGLVGDLADAFDCYENDQDCRAVILTSEHQKVFSVGAKIDLVLGKTEEEIRDFVRKAQELIVQIQYFPKPTIAAINGMTLGGGLELAMACDKRVASDYVMCQLGLPEVKLGVLPGMGGTYNMTKLIGAEKAKEMIANGKIIKYDEAQKMGLVDYLAKKESLIQDSALLAKKLIDTGMKKPKRPKVVYEILGPEEQKKRGIDIMIDETAIKESLLNHLKMESPIKVKDLKIGPIGALLAEYLIDLYQFFGTEGELAGMDFFTALTFEREAFVYLVTKTKDAEEGIRALIEKKKYEFKGE